MNRSYVPVLDRSHLREVCTRLAVRLLVLFGSRATGRPVPCADSDVDLALALLDPRERRSIREYRSAVAELLPEAALDVVLLHDADPLFRWEIMGDSVLLWGEPQDYLELRAFAYRDFVDSVTSRRSAGCAISWFMSTTTSTTALSSVRSRWRCRDTRNMSSSCGVSWLNTSMGGDTRTVHESMDNPGETSNLNAFRKKLNELEKAKRDADRLRQEAVAELLQARKEINRQLHQLGYEGEPVEPKSARSSAEPAKPEALGELRFSAVAHAAQRQAPCDRRGHGKPPLSHLSNRRARSARAPRPGAEASLYSGRTRREGPRRLTPGFSRLSCCSVAPCCEAAYGDELETVDHASQVAEPIFGPLRLGCASHFGRGMLSKRSYVEALALRDRLCAVFVGQRSAMMSGQKEVLPRGAVGARAALDWAAEGTIGLQGQGTGRGCGRIGTCRPDRRSGSGASRHLGALGHAATNAQIADFLQAGALQYGVVEEAEEVLMIERLQQLLQV